MQKLTWKYRLVFAVSAAVLYGILLYIVHIFFDSTINTIGSILFQSLFFGLFFGVGFPYIMESFGKKIGKNIVPELADGESIESSGPANLFRGVEGVGGKLFLTTKNLIFKSHKFNIQSGQTNIAYNTIVDVTSRKTMKLVDNGLRVKTKDGSEYDFVVSNRKDWIELINSKII